MPAWITLRRLGVVTTLYAVFLAGWWLGQPVRSDGCHEDRHAAGGDGRAVPVEPADPGRYLDNLGLGVGFPDFGLLDWADDMDGRRDGEYGPGDHGYELRYGDGTYATSGPDHGFCSYTKRARLLAWVNGDWD
ncbi:hypothetical protein ACIP29_31500 [Streptomyces coelicoflavus]|uniref:hypothetical protein n=1 Tax=Streptomyces coelicoflavus TaxID=285562 RepID=UPI0002476268|nr:secreted protein [Streptomyces coelicoflavus ZG0656]KPC69633.1 hypothetical protein ADL35_39255 [Streptomyces sp. NRRL WC-3753]MZE42673.1 hypothetical protein [Streptomyces sp. SID5477]